MDRKVLLTSLATSCLLLAVGTTVACADEVRTIEGQLQYRERVALPEDAVAVIEARGWQDTLLGETRLASEGQQVPLPFTLEIPAGVNAKLMAGIVAGGRPRWISEGVEVPAGDDSLDLGMVALAAYDPMLFPSTYRCRDAELIVGVLDDNAVMETGGERFTLTRTISASGARYEATNDPNTVFWSKGDKAYVTLRGEKLEECSLVAPETPAPYVARGNEPGWSLTIGGGKLTLLTDYGQTRYEAVMPPVHVEDGTYILALVEPKIRVSVSEIICHDDATGMPYPDTVSVNTGDGVLSGCGGDPLDLLAGTEWVVEDLGGGGIIDRSHLTLAFDRSGRVSGSSGCNVFNAPFTLSGEGLSFGPGAGSMKACSEALMTQERRFLQTLAEVARFDLDPTTGAILLFSGTDQAVITARRD